MPLPEEAQQVLALAKEWRGAASSDLWQPSGDVARFLKLWIAVNALYEMRFPTTRGDHSKLLQFAAWAPVMRAHDAHLGRDTYQRALFSMAKPGVWNYQRGEWCVLKPPFTSTDTLEVVYQIRCNLFHGRKSPANPRDARLIKAGICVAAHILDGLFEQTDEIWIADAA